jgi:peptide/nickel transport system substrate-binding protein
MRTIRRLTGALCAAAALTLATPAEPVWAQSALAESGLIGELEGVTIITDPAQWPTSFSEAPSLAEKVAAGELPPVEERLPEDLMVIQPVDEVGSYGGIWRRGFTGPGDNENGNRI